MASIHKGHRQRLKQEFLMSGLEHFPQHKILELLLFYSIPQGDTNELGHRLMDRFGSLSGVLDAPRELLCEVQGVGPETATFIKFLSSLIPAYLNDLTSLDNAITDTSTAKEYMRHRFLGETVECVYLAGLGNNGKVLFCKKIAQGSPETVGITPALVVKTALRTDAVRVVLAHNHPYGICNPSSMDVKTTILLAEEMARVEVPLLDHIVVAADGVCSMREMRLIPGWK